MSDRPIIGVATQTLEAIPGKLPACWIMGQRYVRALADAGAVPVLIPLLREDLATLRAIYETLDGLFLTGGVDVDPSQYGEDRHDRCDRSDPDRDGTEIQLIHWAMADGKPILGVCRGIQIINVACGGTLYQHLPEQYPQAIKHDYFPTTGEFSRDYLAHPVRVIHGSRLDSLVGQEEMAVNSMHHQGIKRLGSGLRVSAVASDGLIEGAESSEGLYVVAVQWHPEELVYNPGPNRRLFTDFIATSGERRRR